jgi:hypothetical protein
MSGADIENWEPAIPKRLLIVIKILVFVVQTNTGIVAHYGCQLFGKREKIM